MKTLKIILSLLIATISVVCVISNWEIHTSKQLITYVIGLWGFVFSVVFLLNIIGELLE